MRILRRSAFETVCIVLLLAILWLMATTKMPNGQNVISYALHDIGLGAVAMWDLVIKPELSRLWHWLTMLLQ